MCAISHLSSAPKFLSDSLTLAPVIGNPQAISDMIMDLRWAAARARAKARLSRVRIVTKFVRMLMTTLSAMARKINDCYRPLSADERPRLNLLLISPVFPWQSEQMCGQRVASMNRSGEMID